MKKVLGMFMVLGLAFMFTCQEARADSAVVYNPDNGHYYQRIDTNMFWTDAQAYLQSLAVPGYLATITDLAENTFVYSNLGQDGVSHWLGGSDADVEGTWEWVTGEPWTWTIYEHPWGINQPDNGGQPVGEPGQDYLVFWGTFPQHWEHPFYWDDQGLAGEELSFIAEWDSNPNPVPEPATLLLLGSGLVGLFGFGKKKGKELV